MNNTELTIKDITQITNSYEESLIKGVLQRLLNFGYKTVKDDAWLIVFILDKITNHIKNACNISKIPKELNEVVIDRACGEFLFNKKQSNQLDLENFDFKTAVKSLQEGDTKFEFAINDDSDSDETKLNKFISFLMNYGEKDLICYRKLKW